MTKRTEEWREFRWKITMSHGGQYSYGTGWSDLIGYISDCYRRGICFRVQLKGLTEADDIRTWKQRSKDIEDLSRQRSADSPGGLADLELDEEGT